MATRLYSSPMDIELKENELFVNGKAHPRSVRSISTMRDVLLHPLPGNETEVYYMFRAVYSDGPLRYDITCLPPRIIGTEYVKTYGHSHPKASDGITYPEAYQVLKGAAIFLLQKNNADDSVDVLILEAGDKECVLFPPEYGHVTINPANKELILANIVSESFESDYSEYKVKHGAAYYYTTKGWAPNKNYTIRKTEHARPYIINNRHNFECKDLLTEFHNNPKKFEFLEKPSILF